MNPPWNKMWAQSNSKHLLGNLLHLSSLELYPDSVISKNPEVSHKNKESNNLKPYILCFSKLDRFYLSTIKCL